MNREGNIKIKSQYRTKARMNSKQRKARLIFLYSLVFILVITICVALSLTILFKVEDIQVVGNKIYSSEDIINKSGITKEENIFVCSEKNINKNLCNDFPYIESIKLKREIPNKIIICVNESKEAASVKFNDKYAVINSSDKVLDILDSPKENIAQITGVDVSNATIGSEIKFSDSNKQAIIKEIQKAIANEKLENVTNIDVTNIDNPTFTLRYPETDQTILSEDRSEIDKVVAELESNRELMDQISKFLKEWDKNG